MISVVARPSPEAFHAPWRCVSFYVLIALALVFGALLINPARVDPTFTVWLSHGDIAQHFLGWHSYRSEPWTLPLGANPRYGLDMGSSIVFTDSIPLLAVLFKLFHSILPQHFQYAGPWVVVSIGLQAVCAWLLLGRFTADRAILFFGSAFFVLSPAMVARAGGHFALTAHWTLLFALYLYFAPASPTRQQWPWRILLMVTTLIHAYLLYFVFAIWLASLLRNHHRAEFPILYRIGSAALTVVLLVSTMWLAGWFAIPIAAATEGGHYGKFAANLVALANPIHGSMMGPPFPEAATATGIESNHYLGAGAIALAVFALICAFRRYPVGQTLRAHLFLALACISFALLAFSHQMYWGETLLVSIPLPEAIRNKLEFIRGCGRLLWFAHYLILITALVIVARALPPRAASTVVVIAFVVQVVDLLPAYRNNASHQAHTAKALAQDPPKRLRSEFWIHAALKYSEVNFFPVVHFPKDYEPIALWAIDHRIAINAAYFARIPGNKVYEGTPRIERELTTGTRRPKVLYVLQEEKDLVRVKLQAGDALGMVDGYAVIAPGWFSGGAQPPQVPGIEPHPGLEKPPS